MLGECCFALLRARKVQSCVTACLASAILHFCVLSQCCFALLRDRQVMSQVTVCSARAVLCYSVLGECNVMHCVMACFVSAILH